MKNIKIFRGLLIATVGGLMMLSGCSSKQVVNFNVHTEPEGAHIIYQKDNSRWMYLGVTPLSQVEVYSSGQLRDDSSVTLKAMRCGYLEQAKEWSGEELISENKEKGMIFWTPRLIKNTE